MTPLCSVQESGWMQGGDGPHAGFTTRGADLSVELRRWTRDEILDLRDGSALGEELGAVLEGRFELVCNDERHELSAGSGILVPLGEPRRWRLLSDDGVLYRVVGPHPARAGVPAQGANQV